jgi:hypothetical protein
MTLECPVCSFGKTEVCTSCKTDVPTLLDIRTLKLVYACMNSKCNEYLIAKSIGDTVGVALCKTCKVLGPNMRAQITKSRSPQ